MTLGEDTQKLQNYIKNNLNIENKSEKEISDIYQKSIDCITDHNHLYYIENNPIVSDKEYDELFDYLKKIEEYFPHLISGNSPTQTLIGQIAEGFRQASHTSKLLSLENTYNSQDLIDRDERIRKNLNKPVILSETKNPVNIEEKKITYSIEPKFDGISVELIYKNGKLHQAITRGDGLVGEDITNNVKTIKNIPSKLSENIDISVRGEIMMPKSVWKKLNQEKETNGEQAFANTRNAAAGSIKLLDSGEVSKRGLVCFIYDILDIKTGGLSTFDTKTGGLLTKLGLPTFDRKKTTDNIQNVINICLDTETKSYLDNQDCDFDGLVIKIEDNKQREIIGATEHHPRRAVAYKFPAQQVSTQILSIDFQIGRTGIITPVANLSPTQLSGATISRTTLHNFDFVNTKDIKVGDYVRLQRSGEVIPYIVGVIKDKRNGSETTVNPPTKCPICNSKVINEDIHYYCSNNNCPAQIKAKLEHFVSKNCMDISGIGDSIIDILVDQKIISNIADLFLLTNSNYQITLQKLPGFANKKVSEISNQLIQAKEKPLRRLVNGLGIGHVGKKTAIVIVDNLIKYYSLKNDELSSLDNLIKHLTDGDFINNIFGIGEKTVETIVNFFKDKQNILLLKQLEEFGLNFDPIKYYKDKENIGIFEGLTNGSFSITGSFPMSRDIIVQEMQKNGRRFDENPKKDTEIMLIGEKPGLKKSKAQEFETKIIEGRDKIIKEFPFLSNIVIEKKSATNTPFSQSLF
ncbi:NAD-dependent DNA ligase LigA [Candidatus Gracilibacteria bacterium]|nr:NAD-dependent DNA ligase LigA [Candidatus Gracilibacteria bacterium]